MHPARILRFSVFSLILALLAVGAGCAPARTASQPPVAPVEVADAAPAVTEWIPAPEPPSLDVDDLVEEAMERAEEFWREGLEAYRQGDKSLGRDHFDRSLRSLVQVDPVIQGDPRLIAAVCHVIPSVNLSSMSGAYGSVSEEHPATTRCLLAS